MFIKILFICLVVVNAIDSNKWNHLFTDMYHTTDEIHKQIRDIVNFNSEYMSISVDKLSKIRTIVITRPADPDIDDKLKHKKLKVFLAFGEHGREIISSEIALEFIKYMALYTTTKPSNDRIRPTPDVINFLLDHVEFRIIPVISMYSREQVEQGKTCTRKNQNGVDLNRNWDYMFYERPNFDKMKPEDIDFPGIAPFCEPESSYMKKEAKGFRPDVYINYHSGISEMYYGWDHSEKLIPNYKQVHKALEYINERYCNCPFGGAGKIGGYLVFGSSMDWIYGKLNTTYSLTFEVYGGVKSINSKINDCMEYFNPVTKEEYVQTINNWALATFSMAYKVLEDYHGIKYPFSLSSIIPKTIWDAPKGKKTMYDEYNDDKRHDFISVPSYSDINMNIPMYISDFKAITRGKVRVKLLNARDYICKEFDCSSGTSFTYDIIHVKPIYDNINDNDNIMIRNILLIAGQSYNDHFTPSVMTSMIEKIVDIYHANINNNDQKNNVYFEFYIVPDQYKSYHELNEHHAFCDTHFTLVQRNKMVLLEESVSTLTKRLIEMIKPSITIRLKSDSTLYGQFKLQMFNAPPAKESNFQLLISNFIKRYSRGKNVKIDYTTESYKTGNFDYSFSNNNSINDSNDNDDNIILDFTVTGFKSGKMNRICSFYKYNPQYDDLTIIVPPWHEFISEVFSFFHRNAFKSR